MAKSDRFYFENYAAAADCCSKAAAYLQECLQNYDYANIKTMLENMHAIEHEADGVKHEMTAALAKAFVTPMEREDMAQISANIDEVADFIEEVIQRMYVNRIETVMPEAIEFAGKIVECCEMMKEMLAELVNFKKPKKLHEMIITLSHKEEECDQLYLEATLKAADFSDNLLTVMFWRDILDRLEKCADACEHVGDSIETIVMKNN
jgi:predicted phosphate transport protein (TIGR00153 family)